MLRAIVIVGPEIREEGDGQVSLENASSEFSLGTTPLQQRTPLACVEVLGRSLTGRLIDELRRADVDAISVFVDASIAPRNAGVDSSANVAVFAAENPWDMATQKLAGYAENEIDAILVMRASAYVELDLTDFLQSHREQGRAVTRAFDNEGPLDIWIIDKALVAQGDDMLTISANIQARPLPSARLRKSSGASPRSAPASR